MGGGGVLGRGYCDPRVIRVEVEQGRSRPFGAPEMVLVATWASCWSDIWSRRQGACLAGGGLKQIRRSCHDYFTPDDVTRNFTSICLAALVGVLYEKTKCNVSQVTLKNLMHPLNHIESVHGIQTVSRVGW